MGFRILGKRLRKPTSSRNIWFRVKSELLVTTMLALLTLLSATGRAQIPSNRTVDWSQVAIPGGIPDANWPICQTITPSGGADDSTTIQRAVNSCAARSVVMLTAGTYTLHRASTVCVGKSDDSAYGVYESGLCLTDKSIVLRGAGPNQTILHYGDGANVISMGRTYLNHANVVFINITAGFLKGSTQIPLASVSGITIGSYLTITQANPNDSDGNLLANPNGYTGLCDYCGAELPNTLMEQIDKVTNIVGNVVTLEQPLYFDFTTSPQAYRLPNMTESIGLENLRIQPTASSGSTITFKNINLESCAHCWVHNVESDMAVDRSHIYFSDVYGSEISNNYVNDGFSHTSGETYALFCEFRCSEVLIQNNIVRKARHSLIMNGGSGNVFGYNYDLDSYMGEYPNSLAGDNGHGAHPYMNLFEGNVDSNLEFDFAHGSSSHNTVFRNYVNLASTNPSTGLPMTSALFAMNVAYYNNYENVFGNAIGPSGSACTASSYEINANGAQSSTIYKFGYYDDGGTTSPNAALSAKVGQTILRGGNWDCRTNTTVWNNNVPNGSLVSTYVAPQTLPNSLYLPAKPSWFTASAAVWPAVDPAASTKVNKIPAQICYEKGPLTGAAFNPSSCYSTVGPQAPSGLSAIVH